MAGKFAGKNVRSGVNGLTLPHKILFDINGILLLNVLIIHFHSTSYVVLIKMYIKLQLIIILHISTIIIIIISQLY